MAMAEVTISENGETREVRTVEADRLVNKGILYFCEECNQYHISGRYSWADVDREIGGK
jgi:uncharacterized protein YlaI